MSYKTEQEFLFESTHNLQNGILKLFPFKYICIHNLCKFSDTGIIMTSQRCCYARDLQNSA